MAGRARGRGGNFNLRLALMKAGSHQREREREPKLGTRTRYVAGAVAESASLPRGDPALEAIRRIGGDDQRGLMGACRNKADQFPAAGKAFPFPIFVHQRQASVAIASNPMRFFHRRERHVQPDFQQPTFDVTIHRLKPNPGERAPLAENCRSLCIFCPNCLPKNGTVFLGRYIKSCVVLG